MQVLLLRSITRDSNDKDLTLTNKINAMGAMASHENHARILYVAIAEVFSFRRNN